MPPKLHLRCLRGTQNLHAVARLDSGVGMDTGGHTGRDDLDDTDVLSASPPSSYSHSKALAVSSLRSPSHIRDPSTDLTTTQSAPRRNSCSIVLSLVRGILGNSDQVLL